MTATVAVVSAGLSQPSSTRLLADRLTTALGEQLRAAGEDLLVEHVELRPLAHALADNLVTGFPSPELEAAVRSVTEADAVVAVTPVFAASYSGLFKTFVDVIDKDALRGVPVLLAATAGTARHSLVIEHALRPLFSYLQAVVVPTGVFAATEDFGSVGGSGDQRLSQRVERAAGELAALLVGPAGPGTATPRPAGAPRRTDPFTDVTPFEDLLRGGS